MISIIDFLQASPVTYYIFICLIGLSVGSFLNVVIYRLPLMMEQEWRGQCRELLELEPVEEKPVTLSTPASTCPHCQHKIRAWENIPVISYLFLRGKCSECKHPISLQYPAIELLTAILSVTVAIHFGVSWQALFALLLTWSLVAMSVIDIHKQLLPDSITLPMLWLGLVISLYSVYIPSDSSIVGAAVGYLSLWSVFQLFKIITGKEGMGYGDFKLLALFGAWLGWKAIPLIIILSSVTGAIIGISMILVAGKDRQAPIPFGPYLAIAGWISLLWGNEITHWYLGIH